LLSSGASDARRAHNDRWFSHHPVGFVSDRRMGLQRNGLRGDADDFISSDAEQINASSRRLGSTVLREWRFDHVTYFR
jgi:hypothetical protein